MVFVESGRWTKVVSSSYPWSSSDFLVQVCWCELNCVHAFLVLSSVLYNDGARLIVVCSWTVHVFPYVTWHCRVHWLVSQTVRWGIKGNSTLITKMLVDLMWPLWLWTCKLYSFFFNLIFLNIFVITITLLLLRVMSAKMVRLSRFEDRFITDTLLWLSPF